MRDAALATAERAMDSAKEQLVDEFQATLGTLVEEASSELVRKELEAMRNAVEEAVATIKSGGSLRDAIEKIVDDYKDMDIGKDTAREQLNQVLARFPKTPDVKG